MTPRSELELTGNFLSHPFAELVAEIMQARLSGSLRFANADRKSIAYFTGGRLVFAVSNARSARLFEILLRRNRLSKADLEQIPSFSNDFEFTAFLQDKRFLTRDECDSLFTEQIEGIIVDALSWPMGNWTFSPLARVRDGLEFKIETNRLLIDYARCLPVDTVLGRFRSFDESFYRSEMPSANVGLREIESMMLARINDAPMTAAQIADMSSVGESAALHMIYCLWISGLLIRCDWNPAFSEVLISAMRGAKLALKREAKHPAVAAVADPAAPTTAESEAVAPEIVITLDEYLTRVETAITYYDILGLEPETDADQLKRGYFTLARSFHPDRYHTEEPKMLQRVQHAFTELAQAYETLKDPANREIYDYRMRKELAEREKQRMTEKKGDYNVQIGQADDSFQHGFSLLMDEKIDASVPFLARAAHYAPKVARYHAYYGKALSYDESKRHKAEAEMQTAVKLDPNNPTFRLLLAEFFVQQNLVKRAEGELKRLLSVFPSNLEAQDLLASLQK